MTLIRKRNFSETHENMHDKWLPTDVKETQLKRIAKRKLVGLEIYSRATK